MDWTQFATFLIGNMIFTLTLWLWNRSETSADRRDIIKILIEMKDEMKDFHGRLCKIEEGRKK